MSEKTVSSRRIPFWLTLSLMGNMLLVGLLAGTMLRSAPKPDEPRSRPSFERSLSASDRQAFRELMRESFVATSAQRDARRAIRQELSEALQREPFDEEAVSIAFSKLREADEAVHARTHEAMISRLRSLPPEQRERMAGLLAFRPDGRFGRHGSERREEPRE